MNKPFIKKPVVINLRNKIIPICAIFLTGNVWALDLEGAFYKAQQYDPQYQAAKAERNANKAQAGQGWSSYLPGFSYSRQQLPTLFGTNVTSSVSQPIFDAARGAAVAQGGPRSQFADSNFSSQSQDLAQRTLAAVNQIILVNEAISANQGQIDALKFQTDGAQRKFDLGQGTITDLLDVRVKYEQAKANDLTLKANLKNAKDQFAAITGEYPDASDFRLPNKHDRFTVETLDVILDKVKNNNPSILSAKANEKIAQYEIAKASGANLPTVSYVWQKTTYSGVPSTNNGVAVTIPIDAPSFFNTYATYAKAEQSKSIREQTELKAKVDAQKYYDLIEAGQETIKIKAQAMDTAKQSVTANQKSYEAGVKSTTDVLIAIQTLFQARNDYAQAVTSQAANLLGLLLISAEESNGAIKQTQQFLFSK